MQREPSESARSAGALGAGLGAGLAFAVSDALASGALRLPASLWAATLAFGLLVGLAGGGLGRLARRRAVAGALVLAGLIALQGAASASKELTGLAQAAGFALAAGAALLALVLALRGRPAWFGALLLPLGNGLAFGCAWVGLAWGLACAAALVLPARGRRALLPCVPLALLFLHPQRPPAPTRAEHVTPTSARAHGPNVVLLVIDTLRADELPPEGNLVRFAREGVRFTQCTSTAPWTLPAMGSLLTALHPSQHGAVNAATPLPDEVETLAERFAAEGYRTGAFTGGAFVGPGHRLDQGFEHFDGGVERRFPALGPHLPLVWQLAKNRFAPQRWLVRAVDEYRGLAGGLEAAEAWLAEGDGRPTFLLLHTYQAHDYYLYDGDADDGALAAGPPASARFARRLSVHPGELADASQADLDHFRALYRGRIRALDALFPELVRRLEARLGRETLWVVTADHGEGFDAALGRVHHGGRLHDDLLRVPLVLRGPGLAPREVAEPVRHIDVAPTVLELAGLAPLASAAGVSLVPALAGTSAFPPLAFAEDRAHGYELLSVRSAEWKWIRAPGREELFHLSDDPGETRPAPGPGPTELEQALSEFPRRYPARRVSEVELDEATQAHLRALGYVE